MRLLIITSEFPPGPGGIGTHAHQLAVQLTAADWQVLVLSPQDYASLQEVGSFNREQPFFTIRLRDQRVALLDAIYRWRMASTTVRQWQPDVIMASGRKAVWLGSALGKWCGLPVVSIGHGTEFNPAGRGWKSALTQWAFCNSTAVVCVSQYTWGRMLASGIQPRQGQVVPNGADAAQFQSLPPAQVEGFRREIGMEEARLLLTVGNVTERKGQEVVIRAMPAILAAVPDTYYIMIGLPTRQKELTALASDLGVLDRVRFLGRTEAADLVHYLNICDLLVMTSKHTGGGDFEGYGIAVVEAALCGKPAVVSANSGLQEAVVDGETGLVVPENDAGATARAVVSLLQNDNLRQRMGLSAQRRANAEQTWKHRSEAYNDLLRSLVLTPLSIDVPVEGVDGERNEQ